MPNPAPPPAALLFVLECFAVHAQAPPSLPLLPPPPPSPPTLPALPVLPLNPHLLVPA